jgi:predicted aspartyl protease
MGRVLVPVVIENQYDMFEVSQGRRSPDQVRRVEIPDALVGTGAKMLSLPKRMIEALGLQFLQERQVITTAGPARSATYGLVRLSMLGREAPLDVAALPDECPVLIGYIPLEQLDLMVDSTGQRLIGDPFHKGANLIDMF